MDISDAECESFDALSLSYLGFRKRKVAVMMVK
jgi:hypothetical protein